MKRVRDLADWRVLHGAAVLLVLGLFLFSVRPLLTPFVLFLLLLLLVAPYAGTHFHLLIVTATSVLAALWLLATTGGVLAPFVLAFGVAYILDPAVDLVQRRWLPRSVAIAVLALPGIAAVVLGIVFGVPALIDSLQALVRQAPAAYERFLEWLARARLTLLGTDLPLLPEGALARQIEAFDADRVVAFLQERRDEIARRGWEGLLGVGRGLGTALGLLAYLVLTPVLTFYLLRDFDGLVGRAAALVPRSKRDDWIGFARQYDRLLARYLRGQLLVAIIVGVSVWLGLWAVGFPFAGLVGFIGGLFNLVPYLGIVVSTIPALVIAIASGEFVPMMLRFILVFGVIQTIESTVLSPRIVGGSVGLHPVAVLLALALGGFYLGLIGLLLAVPIAVLVKLLAIRALERYRRSAVFLGPRPGDEG